MRAFYLLAFLLSAIALSLVDGLKVVEPQEITVELRSLGSSRKSDKSSDVDSSDDKPHHSSKESPSTEEPHPSSKGSSEEQEDDDDDEKEPSSKGKGKGKGGASVGKGKGGKDSKGSKKTSKSTKGTKKSGKSSKGSSSEDKSRPPSASPPSGPTPSSVDGGTRPPVDVELPTRPPVDLGDLQPVTLSRYAISYDLESDQMPSRSQYMRVVRLTAQYLEEYMIERYERSMQADLVAMATNNASMAFVFGEPALIEYNSTAYFSADTDPLPPQIVLDTVLMEALDDPDDYLEMLQALPSSNPFSTTSAVMFEEPMVRVTPTKSSASAEPSSFGPIVTSAAGLTLILAGALLVKRSRDGQEGEYYGEKGRDTDTYAGDTFVDVDLEHQDDDDDVDSHASSVEGAWEDEPGGTTRSTWQNGRNTASRHRKTKSSDLNRPKIREVGRQIRYKSRQKMDAGGDLATPNLPENNESDGSTPHDTQHKPLTMDEFDEFLKSRSHSVSPNSSFEAEAMPSKKSWDGETDSQQRTRRTMEM